MQQNENNLFTNILQAVDAIFNCLKHFVLQQNVLKKIYQQLHEIIVFIEFIAVLNNGIVKYMSMKKSVLILDTFFNTIEMIMLHPNFCDSKIGGYDCEKQHSPYAYILFYIGSVFTHQIVFVDKQQYRYCNCWEYACLKGL